MSMVGISTDEFFKTRVTQGKKYLFFDRRKQVTIDVTDPHQLDEAKRKIIRILLGFNK